MTSTMDLADAYANETFFVGNGVSPPQKIKQLRAALEQRIKELERDAKRLDWMGRQDLDELSFNFAIDMPHDGEYGVWSCEANMFLYGKTLREAIDRAMSEAALQKLVDISQEYKLP